MKNISEHLGQIIAVLAAIALLVGVISVTSAGPVKDFFGSTVSTFTDKADDMLSSIQTSQSQKNLIDLDACTEGYWNDSGVLATSYAALHTDYISVQQGETYKICNADKEIPAIALFDEDYTFIKTIAGGQTPILYATIDDASAKYMSVNFYAVDAEQMSVVKTTEASAPEYAKSVIFMGDSLTYGTIYDNEHGMTRSAFSYSKIVSTKLNLRLHRTTAANGAYIANGNIPGQASASWFRGGADMVIVMGGVNDFAWGETEFGTIADQTTGTFYGGLNVLFSNLSTAHADKPVVFLTPLQVKGTRFPSVNETTGKTQDEYVAAIKEVCALHDNVIVVDTYTWSKTNLSDEDIIDSLHPTPEASKKIADYVAEELLKTDLF